MRKTSILAQNGPFWPVLRKKGHFLNFFETKNFNFNYTNHISTKKCNIKRFQAIIWSKSSKNPFSMFFHTQIDPILAKNGPKWAIFDFLQRNRYAFIHCTIENKLNMKNQQNLMNGFREKCKKPPFLGILAQNGQFWTVFSQNVPIFEFFRKKRLEHFS